MFSTDLWRYLYASGDPIPHGQAVWLALSSTDLSRHCLQPRRTLPQRRAEEYRCRKVKLPYCSSAIGFLMKGGRTFSALGEKDKILKKLEEVAAELEDDMERHGWTGKTVTLKYKLDTYQGKPEYLLYSATSKVLSQFTLGPNHSIVGFLRRRKTFSQ